MDRWIGPVLNVVIHYTAAEQCVSRVQQCYTVITIDGWWDLQYVVHVTLVEQGKPLSKWSNAYVPPVFKDLIQDGHVFLCTEQKK